MMQRLACVLIVLLASSSVASSAPTERQLLAALVEWATAHCDGAQLPAQAVAIVPMIVNGSTADEMEAARQQVRDRIKRTFVNDRVACSSIVDHLRGSR